MIELKEAQITDSLPSWLSDETNVKALSYAASRQMKKLLAYSDAAKVYADVMKCSHAVLDILAFELQIPMYKDSYPLDTKRRMVLNGLVYWLRMGTVGAMEDLLSDVFSDAVIKEWFNYGGEAGHFMIDLGGYRVTQADVDKFIKNLDTFKRLSAHLDMLRIKLEMKLSGDDRLRYGVVPISIGKKHINLGFPDGYKKRLWAGVGSITQGKKSFCLGLPKQFNSFVYSGQVHLITGKKTIGGLR